MQYKTLINISFPVLMEEFQAHLQDGWMIDPANYPVANFFNSIIHLVKEDDIADTNASDEAPVVEKKPLGRPARKAAQ